MNTIKSKLLGIALGASTALPLAVFAQASPENETTPVAACTTLATCLTKIQRINNFAFSVLLVVAVGFIIYAAFLYLGATGDEEKLKKAKTMIIYAAVAVGVAVLAQTIVYGIKGIVGGI
ncbi:MAG: hypothetical protein A3H06_00830 [Candidatus Colwellbacteria bacterium RIFCSPLOWO2_12_FULL_44_13]|uniref:DUF4134 domain-containing protein n=3 Tax=Candidatus Colwelliibacteriota TaxID=1817904 RepID=A0A1G1Z593_9BACT|nr:MAG: hypothetical protein A3F24_00050 [Candidatus Colwellbacteria bacterium RIFCSPHIGHO2_12_FULL_44_17]OGY59792.1 MAG: hypothetical protein A3I31_01135 [Candidatus Colwellbacteria bacterium RIFCSPLOWO2_02_FULL_44_20b]OGY61398.1 MAG: hypothetical protein A3H06_00830 [Candidatus Colwellbacteria bacterium RIFCSPLOWO2_12_FULL_44_13]